MSLEQRLGEGERQRILNEIERQRRGSLARRLFSDWRYALRHDATTRDQTVVKKLEEQMAIRTGMIRIEDIFDPRPFEVKSSDGTTATIYQGNKLTPDIYLHLAAARALATLDGALVSSFIAPPQTFSDGVIKKIGMLSDKYLDYQQSLSSRRKKGDHSFDWSSLPDSHPLLHLFFYGSNREEAKMDHAFITTMVEAVEEVRINHGAELTDICKGAIDSGDWSLKRYALNMAGFFPLADTELYVSLLSQFRKDVEDEAHIRLDEHTYAMSLGALAFIDPNAFIDHFRFLDGLRTVSTKTHHWLLDALAGFSLTRWQKEIRPVRDVQYDVILEYVDGGCITDEDGSPKEEKDIISDMVAFLSREEEDIRAVEEIIRIGEQETFTVYPSGDEVAAEMEYVSMIQKFPITNPERLREHMDSWRELMKRIDKDAMAANTALTRVKQYLRTLRRDWDKVATIMSVGKAKSLDEVAEFEAIHIPQYIIIAKLGRGSLKKAYLARNIHSGHERAFLMIDPSSKGVQLYRTRYKDADEQELMRRIYAEEFSGAALEELANGPYIAPVSPPIQGRNERGEDVFFLQTIPYDHTLEDELRNGPIPYSKLIRFTAQLATALHACSRAAIVHKDFKPDNIGITKVNGGDILLSDFGCVSRFTSSGDPRYQYPLILRPPELANDADYWAEEGVQPQTSQFTTAANIWTLGMLVYWMFTGKSLINGPSQRALPGTAEYHEQNKEAYHQIHDQRFIEERVMQIEKVEVRNILMHCLRQNPAERDERVLLSIMSYDENREDTQWFERDKDGKLITVVSD
ncbi:protein kinase [Candidatus Woesearchaeota archaeon]|nr:protein kinase [Candidatus Woesearchaeota archaeon]